MSGDWRERQRAEAARLRQRAAPFVQSYGRGRVQESDLRDGRSKLHLMLVDIDYTTSKLPYSMTPTVTDEGRESIIRLYCVTPSGARVIVHTTGFLPYFYCEAPRGFATDADAAMFKRMAHECIVGQREDHVEEDVFTSLNTRYETKVRDDVVSRVEFFPQGYRSLFGTKDVGVLRVSTSEPRFVAPLRNALEHNECTQRRFAFPSGRIMAKLRTYESDMAYVLRFLVDKDMAGMAWFDLDISAAEGAAAGQFYDATDDEFRRGDAHGALSVYAHHSRVQRSDDDAVPDTCVRILSFDIECESLQGGFPVPERGDPVITICASMMTVGRESARRGIVFQLGTCEPVRDADVRTFADEAALLAAWDGFVRAYDPDIITGWNTEGFDFQYLVRRAQQLGIALHMGRMGRKNWLKENRFSSSQYGRWPPTSSGSRRRTSTTTSYRSCSTARRAIARGSRPTASPTPSCRY